MKKSVALFALCLLLAIAFWGCSDDEDSVTKPPVNPPIADTSTCLGCHSSESHLKASLGSSPAPPIRLVSAGDGWVGEVPELEAWEKVIITGSNGDAFLNSVHGKRACQSCHNGQADGTFTTMEEAHVDMIRDPSAVGACDDCHYRAARATANSLHSNLWGEKRAIEIRARLAFDGSGIEDQFNGRCGGCHTTCGQCHISRPNSVGGGFPKIGSYSSHRFRKSPDMNEQCTACHGSRIGTDYKGEIDGNQPDVHRTRGYKCEFCHSKQEIHGDGLSDGDHYTSRYEVRSMPRCQDCHGSTGGNTYHKAHVTGSGPKLQCQVCHSQPYKNCTNCHGFDTPGFDIDPSVVQLKIAQNVNPHRTEYDYSIVRHVPIDPDTYAGWGLALPGYLDEPTWLYASPHNILRWTPQTTVGDEGCFEACHYSEKGPNGFFLRESDLYEADGVTKLPDYDANIGIVIEAGFPGAR